MQLCPLVVAGVLKVNSVLMVEQLINSVCPISAFYDDVKMLSSSSPSFSTDVLFKVNTSVCAQRILIKAASVSQGLFLQKQQQHMFYILL